MNTEHSYIEHVLAGISLGITMSTIGWAGFVAVCGLAPPTRQRSAIKDFATFVLRSLLVILFGFGGTLFRPVVVNEAGNVIAAAAFFTVAAVMLAGFHFVVRTLLLLRTTRAELYDALR